MKATHTDLAQALSDLHQWVLDHPGAKVLPAVDHLVLGFRAYTKSTGTEQSFLVDITFHHAKHSLASYRDSVLARNLALANTSAGRKALCDILTSPNGWVQLTTDAYLASRHTEPVAMNPQVLDEIQKLHHTVQQGLRAKEQAELDRKKAEDLYQAAVKKLIEAAPQFFKDFAAQWPGMEAYSNEFFWGVMIDSSFRFTISYSCGKLMYEVGGAYPDKREMADQYFDIETALPRLILSELERHYRKTDVIPQTL